MAHPASMIKEELTESISQGFVQYELVRTYQVFTNTTGAGVVTALADADVPALGSQLIIPGGSGTETVYCVSRRPMRPHGHNSKGVWHVSCRFTNVTDSYERDASGEPITDPTDTVKRVEFGYNFLTVPVDTAKLKWIREGGSTTDLTIPGWLTPRQSADGPIVNSAGVPQYSEKQRVQKTISVTKVARDWDASWEDYIGSVNSDTVTITETDVDGTRATHSWDAYQLRMDVVRKINTWRNQKLYFAVRFEMTENTDEGGWLHREIDKGTKQRVAVGYPKPPQGSSNYTAQDVETYGQYQSIMANNASSQVAISEPVLLNGEGQPIGTPRQSGAVSPNNHIELGFDIYPLKTFTTLGL